ncbi:MAG: hypothetical protein WAW41_10000 [Methylobacter sp.]
MKRILCAALLFAATASAYAGDIGVSISVGQPGFYGHIDIGNYPQPLLLYPKPIIIQRVPRGEPFEPIYLHVPPGHARKWSKHCREYNACGRPVYFVEDSWYNDVYVPGYRERGGYRNERRDEGRDNDRGRGRARNTAMVMAKGAVIEF